MAISASPCCLPVLPVARKLMCVPLSCPPMCHSRRKKEHTERLKRQLAALEAENVALQSLLLEMNTTGEQRLGVKLFVVLCFCMATPPCSRCRWRLTLRMRLPDFLGAWLGAELCCRATQKLLPWAAGHASAAGLRLLTSALACAPPTTAGLCPLSEASQDGIDAWLKAAGCCAAAAAPPAAAPAAAATNP